MRRLRAWTGTLHAKFALLLTAACCTVAVVIGVLVHADVGDQTVRQARSAALARLDDTADAYTAGDPLPPCGRLDPPELPRPLREMALRGERGTMLGTFRGRPVMWAARPADGTVLTARADYGQGAETLRGLDHAMVISAGVAIACVLLAGSVAVSRVTRRLRRTAAVARRISTGDLTAPDPGTADAAADAARGRDEVADVAAALDAMASALHERLRSEQRFTADVAHELRTPLAGLRASADLLPPGRPTELVRDRVHHLCRLTDDLLEISRLDSATERADLDSHVLGPLARSAARVPGQEADVVVLRDACVDTDRRRLERVLGNLLLNAHRHGRPPVTLTVDGPVITVRDHGPGYPAHLLEHGPQRFRTEPAAGHRGHGLGLTIALGQARTIGAHLAFSNAPDGGAVSTLTLPRATGGAGEEGAGEEGSPAPD
ncbi:ATPase [Streptomyces caatingaensis]|uniref:histidine kinase n=1 Tax=Streptomyces caatingaensis TaxID=1678637 RepID=A0A0K9XLH4_9ACTN|nr:ATPase [Streptomyces caatingaensis]